MRRLVFSYRMYSQVRQFGSHEMATYQCLLLAIHKVILALVKCMVVWA